MPEQVLFALTGFARWSAQIPLTWIVEARSRPVGEALYYLAYNLKLKVVHFSFHFHGPHGKKGDGGRRGGGAGL